MAERPVFYPKSSKSAYVQEIPITFDWSPGLSITQKQKSIDALHAVASIRLHVPTDSILDISSKSPNPIGVALSAFNLKLTIDGKFFPVENIFQASKRFQSAGPFLDLLATKAGLARNDKRLRVSGRLVGFDYLGEKWPLEPKTAFYDWIYLNALQANPDLANELMKYQAFTDIEFNPNRSINCQARSAALYVSLNCKGLLGEALSNKDAFLKLFSRGQPIEVDPV